VNVALFEAILDHANVAMADQFPGQKGLLKEQAISLLDLVLDDMKAAPTCCRHGLPLGTCAICEWERKHQEEVPA
jgi:hypothetical protein